MDFFYPLPNQGTLSTRLSASSSSSCPGRATAQRADLRVDHEAERQATRSSCAAASSTAIRPRITFEGGNALTNLGIQDRTLNTATAIAGWTKIFSPTVVNEFRAGYNYDKSVAAEQLQRPRGQRRSSGSRTRPASAPTASGFPRFEFAGGSAASRPINITDGGLQRRPHHQARTRSRSATT